MPGKIVATCDAIPCVAQFTEKMEPGPHTYIARVASPDGSDVLYTSLGKSYTWTTYKPTTVDSWLAGELTHYITYPSTGATESVVLTVQARDYITASPYYLEVRDATTGDILVSCGTGVKCSTTIPISMQFHTFTIHMATYTKYPTEGRMDQSYKSDASSVVPPISFGAWQVGLTPRPRSNGDWPFRLTTDRYPDGPQGRFGPNYINTQRGTMVLIDRTSGVVWKCPDYLQPNYTVGKPMQWTCDIVVPAAEIAEGDLLQAAVMSPYKGCTFAYRSFYDCRDEQATSAVLDTSPQYGTTPYLIVDPDLIHQADLVAQTLQQDGNLDKLGVRPSVDGKPSAIVRDSATAATGTTTPTPSYLVDSTRFAGGFAPADRYQYAT